MAECLWPKLNYLFTATRSQVQNVAVCWREIEAMDDQLVAVNIPEAARRLGLSIRTIATLVSRRELVGHEA